MKITHIIDNLYAGGAQTFVVLLAIEQSKLGHDVSLLIIDKLTGSSFEESLLSRLKNHQVKVTSSNRRLGKNFSVVRSVYSIRRYLKRTRPQIINSHLKFSHLITSITLRFSAFASHVHIVTVHNAPEVWDRLTYLLNKNKPAIYCSQASQELSLRSKSGSIVISNGIKKPYISDSAEGIIENLHIDGRSKIVLCVGKLSAQKNYNLVSQIAENCTDKNVCFLIAGLKGNTYEQDLVNFNRIPNIYYLGTCVPDQIHSLMNKCDVFLNTSRFEGLPITVLEAFFIGTPCLLSPIPPHFEIGNRMPGCTIAETFNHDEYVELLQKILEVDSDKGELIKQRKEQLIEFEINTTARNYLQFYQLQTQKLKSHKT